MRAAANNDMTRTIIAIVGVVLSGAIFILYTKPTYDGVKVVQAQIAEQNQALDKSNELQKRKQELLTKRNALNPADIDRLHKLLPDHVDNVRLLLDLDNLANRHGLTLQNVVLSNPDNKNVSQTALGVIGADKQAYDSLTFKFTTHGTYASYITFMEDLERSLRIVDLVSLAMDEDSNTSLGVLPEPVYKFEMTIRTYWLK